MIVIDASALICLLTNTPAARASAIRDRIAAEDLHAPHLVDAEVAQTLRRYASHGDLRPIEAEDVLDDLLHLPIARHPHYLFLNRVWQLRANLSAYDALYVALAELLDAPLLTLDARMARGSTGSATIEVF